MAPPLIEDPALRAVDAGDAGIGPRCAVALGNAPISGGIAQRYAEPAIPVPKISP